MGRKAKKVPKHVRVQKLPGPAIVASGIAPEEDRTRPIDGRRIVAAGHFFSGPIPSPAMLKRYNDILPNAADRILAMAEQQQNHRIHIEKTVIESDAKRADIFCASVSFWPLHSVAGLFNLLQSDKACRGWQLSLAPSAQRPARSSGPINHAKTNGYKGNGQTRTR